MRKTFHHADLDALARLWNEFHPPRYRIDADLMRQNTVDCSVFDWGASVVWYDGKDPCAFVAVKKSPAPKLYRPGDPDRYHVCALAYREPETGVDLLADVKQVLRERGGSGLVFGQDCRHFWPGCPRDCHSLHDFLIIEGFLDGTEQVDLERNLTDYEAPCELPDDERCGPLSADETERLDAFLETEFPGRWRHDVMEKVQVEGPQCVFVSRGKDGIEGFALTQDWNHRLPISGAVWRSDLGEHWSSLGPIGMAKAARGKGDGHALLAKALTSLKERGAGRCIIDWTTLVDFYGRHGFEVSRRYVTMQLRLEA
jgi:GNAT superfamily N-acetyltransferase